MTTNSLNKTSEQYGNLFSFTCDGETQGFLSASPLLPLYTLKKYWTVPTSPVQEICSTDTLLLGCKVLLWNHCSLRMKRNREPESSGELKRKKRWEQESPGARSSTNHGASVRNLVGENLREVSSSSLVPRGPCGRGNRCRWSVPAVSQEPSHWLESKGLPYLRLPRALTGRAECRDGKLAFRSGIVSGEKNQSLKTINWKGVFSQNLFLNTDHFLIVLSVEKCLFFFSDVIRFYASGSC